MNPQEKIRFVKNNIDEQAEISPKGPIHLKLYSVTHPDNEEWTLLTRSEQWSIIKKLEEEGYIKNISADEDGKGVWLEKVQPLRGVVRCEHCGRVYTPYTKKGIQYYNSRCVKGCSNTLKNFNFDFIDKKIGGLIKELHFTEEEIEQMDARAGTDIALLEEKRHKMLDQTERKKKKIREDLAYLRSNKISLLKSGVYTPESYVAEETKLDAELSALKNDEDVSDIAMHETMKEVQKLSELVKNVAPYYQFAKPHEKEQIVRVIFSELSVSQNTLKYKCKKGFECFENRFLAICDPTGSRTRI